MKTPAVSILLPLMLLLQLVASRRVVPSWFVKPKATSWLGRVFSSSSSSNRTRRRRAFLAVGSNLGDRFHAISTGLERLNEKDDVRLIRTSALFETPPMYVEDQPAFLNGVVEVETSLEPMDLLKRIKRVEKCAGRDLKSGVRNGPRPLDVDILFYGNDDDDSLVVLNDNPAVLEIPHARIAERSFVLEPLVEMGAADVMHPVLNQTIGQLYNKLMASPSVRVLPLPRGRMLYLNETIVMGILNVTPDSFSDGGNYTAADIAVQQALVMVQDGAGIIDVGGESTRPGAKEVAIEEELSRTIPVIRGIRKHSDIPISIDTRHAPVADAAIQAGADIVNDVSGGLFDTDMLSTVAKHDGVVPMILMHTRGTPETMQTMTDYKDIVDEVIAALRLRSEAATQAGIHRWHQVLDPGIGFAKDLDGNLQLLRDYHRLQGCRLPLVLGTSRKGFIGTISGETVASERDFGTLASCVAAICLGGDNKKNNQSSFSILRVHNVKGIKQGTLVMDAIIRVVVKEEEY